MTAALLVNSPILIAPANTASSSGPRLGFWLQDSDAIKYPASTFFNAMFMTPPYPSSVEVMIFAIQQDESNGYGCSASANYVGSSINYWGQVAQMANSYPNIRLIFEIAFDPSSGGSGTYGLSCFNTMVQALSQFPSVYGLGVEGEYTKVSDGMTEAQMQTAMNDVTSAGKLFINYYAPVAIPSGGYDITHTNFPAQGDQVGTLQDHDSQTVGISSGYYDGFPFPSTFTCPIGPNDVATGALTNEPQGYNQCVISTELSAAVSFSPTSARQFLELCPGFSSSGSFTGASGQSTNQLWDSPTLRNWIWTDPNYQPNFVLSTSAVATTSTSRTTSTSSGTTTTSQRTSSTTSTTSTTSTSSKVTTTSQTTSAATSSTTSTSRTSTTSSTSSTSSSTTSSSSSSPSYSLSTYVECPGAVSYCGVASPVGSWNYSSGTVVTLTATPYGGFLFSSWSICTGSCQSSTTNPLPLTLSVNTAATAIFVSVNGNSTTTTSTTATSSTTAAEGSTSSTTTTTTSTSASTSQTTSRPTTATVATHTSEQDSALSVVGNCPSTGAGTYAIGSTAVVEFAGICDRSGGTGLRVSSWSLDGMGNVTIDTNATLTISIVMDSPHTMEFFTVSQDSLTLDYGAQASLLAITPPTVPGDNYWYDSGTRVTFTGKVDPQGYTVAGWALDGASPVAVSGVPDFVSSFAMIAPHTLHVLLSIATGACTSNNCASTPTFDVTVQTNANNPAGTWIDGDYYSSSVTFAWQAGSVHNITAVVGTRQSSVRTAFSGWSGESHSQSPTLMLSVNESGHLVADYSRWYLVSLSFTDASGEPLTPQSVTLTGPLGAQKLGANLTAWVEANTRFTVTSAMWMNWNVIAANESTFSVSQPASLGFPTDVYHQTIRVTDVYNLPLQGATVNVTALNGVKLSAVTDAHGSAEFRVPLGLFTADVGYMGVSNQVTASSEGSHNYAMSFLLSYPLLATVGTISAVTAAFVLFSLLRKRPDRGLQFFSD